MIVLSWWNRRATQGMETLMERWSGDPPVSFWSTGFGGFIAPLVLAGYGMHCLLV